MGSYKRITDWHTKVLTVLRGTDEPLSAYDVLGELRQFNPKIAPPTVYRALAALTDSGQIHRLESLNSYIACRCDHHQQAPVFSVCDDCGSVEEYLAPQVLNALSEITHQSGFTVTRQVIELRGRCTSCLEGSVQ